MVGAGKVIPDRHRRVVAEKERPDIVHNVGSLFLGYHAPVAVGDYFSGTNHILPTGGTARFSSGTSVETFTRRTTWQYLTKEALARARIPVTAVTGILARASASFVRYCHVVRRVKVSTEVPEENRAVPPVGRIWLVPEK